MHEQLSTLTGSHRIFLKQLRALKLKSLHFAFEKIFTWTGNVCVVSFSIVKRKYKVQISPKILLPLLLLLIKYYYATDPCEVKNFLWP